MKTYPYLIGILFVMLMASCNDNDSSFDFVDQEGILVNSWMQTWDGKCMGKLLVFNPLDSTNEAFVLWQLRNRLTLYADHSAEYAVATPIDPHLHAAINKVKGKWAYYPDSKTLLLLDDDGGIYYSFDVHAIANNALVLSYSKIESGQGDH